MLHHAEIESIKDQLRAELMPLLREQISREITGGIGRAIKKLERQQQAKDTAK